MAGLRSQRRPIDGDPRLLDLRQYPDEQVSVEGHTNNVGGDDYNQRLSEQRAFSVRDCLVDQGVPAERVSAVGFGKTRPKSGNDTPEGRQVNRRVEIHIRATARSSS